MELLAIFLLAPAAVWLVTFMIMRGQRDHAGERYSPFWQSVLAAWLVVGIADWLWCKKFIAQTFGEGVGPGPDSPGVAGIVWIFILSVLISGYLSVLIGMLSVPPLKQSLHERLVWCFSILYAVIFAVTLIGR